MTSLICSGGSGDGGGGSSGSGGGHPSSCCGAVRWGVSGGGQMWVQQRQHEALTPQQLQFGDAIELPRWLELVRKIADIFTLDYDAILTSMYALSASDEGDCSRCVPPNPGIVAAALCASESGTLPGTAPAEALHTLTLDSSASRCFFRDSTNLTPLPALVPVRLADPSGGPVVARSSTVLPCPAVPSGSLSGLHLPSFSTNLVSTAALQDTMVTTTTPGGSSVYTLATEPPQVAASAQVSASGQVAASCSCRLLSHQNLLWHHRLGHPSLPRLRGMHSRLLVSGLPRSLPPLPPSPTPPCLPCVEGRQRTAPHSSFPPTTAPLQTLHMDVWGPARVSGQGRERYFLLVVDDYTRYTTVFPLRSKGEVIDVLIPWIHTVRLQLRERFGQDLPVLRLHFDRGGEFSSNLLRDFCRGEGILQWFTLPDSPQQNGIAERCIGLVMELNLWPRVSLPETSPTLRWTGEVGDASVFRVWGSRAFVRDTSAEKLSARAIPCVFLGFVLDAPGWQFYHPTSRRVFASQDVTFDESVPFYYLFPYRSAPPPPATLFLAPGPPSVDPLLPQGPAPLVVSQVFLLVPNSLLVHSFLFLHMIPRWGDLSRAGVAIFDLDYDAILAAMYALSTSDEGDCYLCLPPDPGGGAAALGAREAAALGARASAAPGAGESALSGTASAQVFHTFTLDSGASRSFRDRTTLTPLCRPVAVSLADPSGGPVLASFSTVLPCPAAPSGTLSGLY
ncbi:unnamed protein product [Closterium sp. NIES-53]